LRSNFCRYKDVKTIEICVRMIVQYGHYCVNETSLQTGGNIQRRAGEGHVKHVKL